MARKLIDQAEAARILGITSEQVGSLRDRKKLFPYRDGDQWKFKQEDIERYKSEMEAEKSEGGDEWEGDSELSDVELQLNDDLDSVLLSEIELGNSAKEGMSTIIGKMTDDGADADLPPAAGGKASKPASTGDSGITLAGESGMKLAGGDSGITLGQSSDLNLAGGSTIPLGGPADSDVKLVSGSELGQKPGSSDKLFGSDALRLSDDELSLVDTGMGSSVAQTKTGDSSKKTAGSSIKLGDEELEVVLGGSDVTQSPTDSGIQLISASDSGLSLDEPLALGSSARRLLDVEDATEAASPEDITEIKADDDFLLTAMDDITEESSDSGSQVIALDSDDEISSGMFAPLAGGAGLLEEEPGGAAAPSISDSNVIVAAPMLAPQPGMIAAVGPAEAPFSTMNVTFLIACALLLLFCGMLTFDLMRNMWSWDGPYAVNSSIMDGLGNTVGWFEK